MNLLMLSLKEVKREVSIAVGLSKKIIGIAFVQYNADGVNEGSSRGVSNLPLMLSIREVVEARQWKLLLMLINIGGTTVKDLWLS